MPDTPNPTLAQTATESPISAAPAMVLGVAMPDAVHIPTLSTPITPDQHNSPTSPSERALSILQDGWHFKGKAQIKGACSISGSFEGQLDPLPLQAASIVITETGMVQADLHVSHASVMGLFAGTLHAPGGRVELHPSAVVSGHIQYGKLLVNDADLNATIERVAGVAKVA